MEVLFLAANLFVLTSSLPAGGVLTFDILVDGYADRYCKTEKMEQVSVPGEKCHTFDDEFKGFKWSPESGKVQGQLASNSSRQQWYCQIDLRLLCRRHVRLRPRAGVVRDGVRDLRRTSRPALHLGLVESRRRCG